LSTESKILTLADLVTWRDTVRRAGQVVVATNGCFDILHAGHVIYLEAAREQGDLLLIPG
jgi:bifunctional ADP-heptose synthase (sugar kinase/adenylyltransferase)